MQATNHNATEICITQQEFAGSTPTSKSRTVRSLVRRALHFAGSLMVALSLLTLPLTTSAATSEALPSTGAAAVPSQYFSVTGKVVRGDFLNAFKRFGLASIGYPLSDETQEGGRTVQYFERVRMEHHPETAGKGFPVLMTRLGDEMSKPAQPFAAIAPFTSTKSRVYIKETSHSISEPFLSYWKTRGGVELFGYPISEAVVQEGLRVQWFERARFEYHPELTAKGQAVQLSLLGRTAYEKSPASRTQAKLQPAPVVSKPASKPAGQEVSLSGMESYLLEAMNAQRAAAGVAPAQANAQVTELARSRSGDMAERNYFSHTTPEGAQFLSMLSGTGFQFKYAGEILARNNFPDDQAAEVAMNSYLNSAPHKAILMDGRYNLIGIGYAKSAEDGMHYYTVIFVQQ